jgi:hypothetical protein
VPLRIEDIDDEDANIGIGIGQQGFAEWDPPSLPSCLNASMTSLRRPRLRCADIRPTRNANGSFRRTSVLRMTSRTATVLLALQAAHQRFAASGQLSDLPCSLAAAGGIGILESCKICRDPRLWLRLARLSLTFFALQGP